MTLFGPDISKWQAGIATANLGFGYLMCRASIGETIDPLFFEAVSFARSQQLPFAGYHFPYEVSKHSAAAQASTFDRACDGDTSIRAMIDWESDGSEVPTVDDAVKVAEAIQALGYKVTLLYTGSWYWQAQGSPDMTRLDELGIGFIIANYGDNMVGEAADVYAHHGGDDSSVWTTRIGGILPTFWQFGSQVHIGVSGGISVHGDCNAFRGTTADLADYFTTWGSTPPDDQEDDMKLYAGVDEKGNIWVGNGITRRKLKQDVWNATLFRGKAGTGPQVWFAGGSGASPVSQPDDVGLVVLTDDALASLGQVED